MNIWYGSIEDCLATGEYDCGDTVQVSYDELYDLAEQVHVLRHELSFCDHCNLQRTGPETLSSYIERRTNRPLHPVLGGNSPYTQFLPL